MNKDLIRVRHLLERFTFHHCDASPNLFFELPQADYSVGQSDILINVSGIIVEWLNNYNADCYFARYPLKQAAN